MNGEQDGIWMEQVFIFFVYCFASRVYQEKSQKAPERNNGFHYESDIVGNIGKSREKIGLDVSRNG